MDELEPQVRTPQAGADKDTLLIRMLYDEQARLRTEIEDLRKKQEESSEDKSENEGKKGEKDQDDKKQKDQKSEGGKSGEEKEQKKPPLKERLRNWVKAHRTATILIVIGFILLVIAAVLLWRYIESYENTDDAFVDGHTDPISPRISGIVTAVYVENTYHVKRGQVLVELDPRDYEIALERSSADLAQAQAGVGAQTPNVPITQTSQSAEAISAEQGVASAQANLAAAQQRYKSALSDLNEAQVNEENAAREEQRYRLLVAKEEVSRELYDQRATEQKADRAMVAARQQTADASEKDVHAAEAALHQAEQRAAEATHNVPRQIAVQRQTLQMRKANAQAAQAQVDQAQLNLQYTRIYAPEDGVVGDKTVELGSQITAGQELLAITQINDIWVTANFKETQIRRMRPGQPVTIHVDALKQNFDGYVEALSGASGAVYSLLPPENATGNYVKVVQRIPVRIRFKPNQPGLQRLAPGMSVEPKVWIQ
jgi:membrane fusion protein (multidrug efflux system)